MKNGRESVIRIAGDALESIGHGAQLRIGKARDRRPLGRGAILFERRKHRRHMLGTLRESIGELQTVDQTRNRATHVLGQAVTGALNTGDMLPVRRRERTEASGFVSCGHRQDAEVRGHGAQAIGGTPARRPDP